MTEISIPIIDDSEKPQEGVVFSDPFDSEYGKKVCVEIPDDGYDTMMELEWNQTHRRWSPTQGTWTIDFDAFGHVIAHWLDDDVSVAVTESCIAELESI